MKMEQEKKFDSPELVEEEMPLSGISRHDSDSTWTNSEGPSQDKHDMDQLFIVSLEMILSLFT